MDGAASGGCSGDAAAQASALDSPALAKVDALWELVQESHVEHGAEAELTRALEAKLEVARREYIGGSGPREVTAPFHSGDERWHDGCVEVEQGWFVHVVDEAPGWCTVRVNGMAGSVPAAILRLPQEQGAAVASGQGGRRRSMDSLNSLASVGSLSAAADVASRSVTGLIGNVRRLKAQLVTAVDELSVAAATAAEGAFPLAAPAIVSDGEAAVATRQAAPVVPPGLPALEPRADDGQIRRAFPASVFLRDIGDIPGQLVFTATQLAFVPLAPEQSQVSATLQEARELLWSTLAPRAKNSCSLPLSRELHQLVFAIAHVVYFGIENPAANEATSADRDSGGVARMVAQSGIQAGTVSVPLPKSEPNTRTEIETDTEAETETETEMSRMHQLHGDLEALGLTPGRTSRAVVESTGSVCGDQLVPPQIQDVLRGGNCGELQVLLKIVVWRLCFKLCVCMV